MHDDRGKSLANNNARSPSIPLHPQQLTPSSPVRLLKDVNVPNSSVTAPAVVVQFLVSVTATHTWEH
uniref:Uncharacterized protein n=1 Tax=Echinococcus granulosus TaxID=6210 RepID=A0A068WVI9_ECHGR|nr:hypothetical protein EgrG_002032100 [Echinococcus granulosus]